MEELVELPDGTFMTAAEAAEIDRLARDDGWIPNGSAIPQSKPVKRSI
jgi:hypothetical protein